MHLISIFKQKNDCFWFCSNAQSLLDLDQRDIETLLGALTEDSLGLAREIYKNGKNSQGYTIQELSLGSDAYMSRNGTVGEYFATYQKFVDFYGTFDFAHAIISAAFEGNTVELNEHSFYFSAYGVVGRAGKSQN